MTFKNWLLTEAVFDREVTEISRAIVKFLKTITLPPEGQLVGALGNPEITRRFVPPDLPIRQIDYSGDYNVVVLVTARKINLRKFYVQGTWHEKKQLILVKIDIDPRTSLAQNLYEMIPQIKGVLRHELEHSTQDLANAPPIVRVKDSPVDIVNYYADPTEIPAWTAGLRTVAKTKRKQKATWEQEAEQELAKLKFVANHKKLDPVETDKAIDTVRQAWQKEHKRRYS